ncbi:MAG: choice-of-anchor Q domain-containing protein [Bryobacteraceae bacterium]
MPRFERSLLQATDQRNIARPQGSACDIGAFELAPLSAFSGPRLSASYDASGPGYVNTHARRLRQHYLHESVPGQCPQLESGPGGHGLA